MTEGVDSRTDTTPKGQARELAKRAGLNCLLDMDGRIGITHNDHVIAVVDTWPQVYGFMRGWIAYAEHQN